VARKAIAAGAQVVIASRDLAKLELAAEEIGGNIQVEQLDVCDESSVIDFFRRVGEFDHLAATIKPRLPSGSFLKNETGSVMAAFDAKFWGQYRLARQATQTVRKDGSIVLTSGIAAARSYMGYSAVSAMNAATEALAKALAIELAPLRVNVVCPGFVDTTPPTEGRLQYVKNISPNLPLDRLGRADEIAEAYLYLFGNAYSTGSVIVVDGGAAC
jgi:NAD(P)-dependent dehydrogenase (short-subunit alcohol dehydrogenase family)